LNYNSDFRYDLSVGQLAEGYLGNILSNKKVEVKFDFGAHRTGNVYIEYMSRGKLSGIATTTANYWLLVIASESASRLRADASEILESDIICSLLIPVPRLKEICRTRFFRRDVPGGDDNTSLGVLVKVKALIEP
jgi:hypothetical protein